MLDLNLSGKNAVIGGASRGIGKAIAEELAAYGATIYALARNKAELEEVIENLSDHQGQQHTYFVADFQKPSELNDILWQITHTCNIHILVNNTGGPPPGPANLADPEDYLKAFNQHLICNQLFVKAFIEGMKKDRYGRIINIISTSVKQPIPNLGVSNTIRGAVANWAKTLSLELAEFGITVNNILPGATYTDRLKNIIEKNSEKFKISFEESEEMMKSKIPAKRFADPRELAYAACFLASPAAAYINGINLPVDGGRTSCL